MKRITALILLICLAFTGCNKQDTNEEMGFMFKDDLGRDVYVVHFKRTAVLLGSFAEVWQLAGGEVCATADDAWEDFGLELSEDCVNLGNTKSLSLEKLIASNPDFVIASTNTKQHIEWEDTLLGAGINVAYFNVSGFDDYLRMLEICTNITGRKDLYEKNGLAVKKEIEEVIKKAEAVKNASPDVLFLRASASYIRAKNSKGSVLGEMLADLGCINIADSNASLLENLSLESIVKLNPGYIFIVQVGDDYELMKKNAENMFKENPAWKFVDAVNNNRIYYLDKKLYNLKPNVRWGEAYEKLYEILAQP